MTLVNPAEKITTAPLTGRPATQEEIQAIQRFEDRIMAELRATRSTLQESSNIVRDTIQKVDTLTQSVRETRESITNSQPVEEPTLFQQIGDFIVTCCRSIGRLFTGRR